MAHDDEAATWRQWTNLLARIRFGTQKVAGRTISGALIKAILERVATYGDGDGTRVRPGIARIAIDMETAYTTVRNAITIGERVGLLRCVREATRTSAAEYRLIIGAQLIEQVELWTPARYALEVQRYAEKYRGKHRSLTPEESAVPMIDFELLTPEESANGPIDQPTADSRGVSDPAIADSRGGAIADSRGVSHQPVTNHKTYQPTGEDVRTAVTGPRASDREDPETQQPVDLGNRPRCPHGRSPRRDNGVPRCPECRTAAETTPAPVAIGPSHCPTHGRAMAAGVDAHGVPRCTLCRHQPKEQPA